MSHMYIFLFPNNINVVNSLIMIFNTLNVVEL